MAGKGVYIYSHEFLDYKFSQQHPFNPLRLKLTTELLEAAGLLQPEDIVQPNYAALDQLELVHDPLYIEMVQAAGLTGTASGKALSYGLGTGDNPIFRGMHHAASLVVGATIKAAELVMENKVQHALNIGGGLHHAQFDKASGFCIYNDAAAAIAWALQKYKARIMYIDTDAHHGDGVQWLFYNNPEVLTVSIHESGTYLFPGTGSIDELGIDRGAGYSINLPLEPYTHDTSYIECLEDLLVSITKRFKPDLIISQNGCDNHFLDPLAHLSLTTRALREIPQLTHNLAHEYCEGRWVAVGGGGYDIWRVVPRAWAMVWAEVANRPLPIDMPSTWLHKWQEVSPVRLPEKMDDDPGDYPLNPKHKDISEKNKLSLLRLKKNLII